MRCDLDKPHGLVDEIVRGFSEYGITTLAVDRFAANIQEHGHGQWRHRIKPHMHDLATDSLQQGSEAMGFDPARIAVSMKCTFCVDRIDEAAVTGRIPGVHPEVTPACVNSCISGAMEFGDIEDPESNVSQLLARTQHYRMHEELGTDPGFYYIFDKK